MPCLAQWENCLFYMRDLLISAHVHRVGMGAEGTEGGGRHSLGAGVAVVQQGRGQYRSAGGYRGLDSKSELKDVPRGGEGSGRDSP